MLRATRACTFSTSQLATMVREWCVLYILAWKCALASLLFDPPEPQTSGKNTVFRGFPIFSRTWIFFLLTVSSLILFRLLFSSDCLFFDPLSSSLLSSYSSHLCVSSVRIVGSLNYLLGNIHIHIYIYMYLHIYI